MNRARRFCLLGVLVLAAGLDGLPVLSQGGLTISGYQLISEVRVSRTVSEYTYRAALTNNGGPLAGATAAATSASPNTTMIDGSLTFGPVGSGATILSTDTFSFRHNRTFAFDWANVQWSVTGQAANQPPVANAGADQTVATGSTVTLNGSGSTDADGNALTYAWSFVARPAGSGATLFNPTSLSPTFIVDLPGSYTVRLIVNDGTVSSAPDTVTISTTNSPPVANAGPDRTAAVGVPVALDGSASADADGNPLTFAWSFVSRPAGSAAIIGSPSSVSPTFVPDVAGSYVVQLVVNDGLVNSASDTMTVSTVNSPPVANAGADQTALTGSTVTLNGSGSTDADGDSLTYAWSFVSRPMGSVAALSNPAAVLPTFTVDVAGTYVVQLIVHDGTVASAPDTMTVSTLNSPPVANAGPDESAAVGGIAFLNGTGSSDADGDPLTFAWAFTSRPVGSSATLTGALGSNPSFVVDRAGTYVVQLIVHDGMVTSAPDTVTITTTNSPPAANAGPDQLGVSVGSTVTLFGGASNDPDGNGLTFAWSFTARPAGSLATLTGANTAAPTFTPDVAGDYVVQLIVNDGLVSSAPDTVLVQAVAVTPEVNVSATDPSASESGPDPGTFTVTRTGLTTQPLQVFYLVAGTAANVLDYSALTGVVTIPAGQISATVTVVPVDDPAFEGDETVSLTLMADAAYIVGVAGTSTLTIADNDVPTVTVATTDAAASETGPDAGAFTVTRTGATTASLNVQYSVGGTATGGADYTPLTGSVTIAAGQASATVTVIPVDDPDFEGHETVSLTLTANVAYSVGAPGTASVTIADNDVASVTVTATDAAASEAGPDAGTFTVTRTGATTASLNVQYSVGGTATSGADYTPLTGSVTIGAGQSSAIVTVTPVDDPDFEGDETLSLTLSANAAYSVGTPGTATVTIADNDVATVTVAATDAAASETGLDVGTFTVTRTGATTASLNVQYSVGGTATSGADYTPLTGSVTIGAGQSSAIVTVTPVDDPDFEGDETLSLTLSANAAYSVGTPGTATVTIADNDVATVTVAATDAAASETGLDVGTFTVTRTGATTASLNVQYSVGGTATSGADYAALTGTVTIAAGQASATVTVTPVDDPDFEGDETVSLTLSANVAYSVGTPGTATVTIADNDVATVTVAATDAAASETGLDVGTFTVTRTGATTASLNVQYSVGGTATSGADYAALTGSVTIAAGQASATVTVTPVDDPDFEGDETVSLTVSANAAYSVGAAASATVTIADNDVATVTVTATDAAAAEAGQVPGTFTITRAGATTASLDVQYSVSGSATSGADYAALTGTVTIPAGQPSAAVTVTPVDDPDFEGAETVSLTLTTNVAYRVGTPGAATVTIADNDVPTVTVAATDAAASETGPDAGTITITRTGATTAPLDVQYSVGGSATSGADYAALTGTVTIPVGQLSVTVTVTPIDDPDFEDDETVSLTLTANAAYSVGAAASVTVTIADNDVPVVTVAATDAVASETGPDAGTFTVTRTGATTASLNVQYSVGGTATSGADYAALTGTVTIPAGQSSATVTVTPVDDSSFEGDETVSLTLTASTAYGVGTPGAATVTIADNDVPTVTVVATDAAAAEAGQDPGTFTITRAGATTASLDVQYSVGGSATSGADYAALTGAVTIAAGQSSATVTVTPVDDADFEGDETVALTLTTNAAYSVGTPGAATVTIADNDVPTVTIAATDAAASETGPDAGTFTVTRTGATTASLNVQYSVGGTATSGADYAALTGTVTIAAGQSSATVTVTPIDDPGFESDETVTLSLTANVAYSVGTPGAATVTITDNDVPTVTVAATDAAASETGPDAGTFTVTRTGVTTASLNVQYSVGGTATSGADYAALTGTVTIPAGQASETVTVTPVNDAGSEGDETVVLTLTANAAYSVGTPAAATVTIADNDAPAVTVVATDATAGEAGPDAGTFTITRTGATTLPLAVQYGVGGTASGADYAALTGTVTIPAGQLSATVTVTPVDDGNIEADETVVLTLSGTLAYSVGTPGSAVITIVDNDRPTVTVAATDGTEAGPTTGNFTFTRTGDTSIALTVNYAVTGTATQADYVQTLSGVITFASGQSNVVALVTPRLDALLEGNETIIATLTAGQYVIGTPGAATLTIVDNAPVVTVAATDGTEAGPTAGNFTFTRTGDPNIALTVNYAVTGTATQADYVQTLSGVITFASGQLAVVAAVTPRLDALLEGNETIIATLTAGQYVIGTPGAATLTIVDNAPTITVTATDGTEAGQVPGAFTFTRTGDPNIALTVNYTVTGTATQADYVEAVNGVITFASGQLAVARVVTPRLDALLEGDETIIATLTAGQYVIGSPNAATLTIVDNAPTITVTATDGTEAGQAPGAFTFTRTGDPNIALTVNYAVTGTATQADYVEAVNGVITFASGQLAVARVVTPRLDALLEGDETIIATLTAGQYVIGTPAAATLTIVDNAPTITVTATDGTEAGQAPGAFTFTRTGDPNIALTVNYAVTGTATQADYVETLSGVITFASGQANVVAAVTPRLDALLEGDETVIATLTAGQYVIGASNAATLTVVDNAPTITVTAANGTEAGQAPGAFTFTRTGDTNIALTVNYAVTGTATQADYVQTLSGVITFPSGQSNVVAAVTPRLDALLEGNETIIATLTAGQYVIGTPDAATLTIVDNAPTITVAATNGTEAGPTPGNFTFTRTGDTNIALTVNYAVTGTAMQADYVETLSGVITFPSGQSNVVAAVTPRLDALLEGNETIIATLTAGQYVIGTPDAATLTIVDNAPTITVAATNGTEAGPTPGNFTFTRTGDTNIALTVNYAVTGTATQADYVETLSGTLAFASGQSSVTQAVTPVDDALFEGDETVVVTLGAGQYQTGTPSSATVTIADNDVTTVTITATDADATEIPLANGNINGGTFTITRTGPTTAGLDVGFTRSGTATSGVDYSGGGNGPGGGSVTIPSGQTSAIVVFLPFNDGLVEGNETVALTLSPSAGYVIGVPASASVAIVDNVQAITVVATDAAASEAGPNSGTFTITRTGDSSAQVIVNFSLTGTATAADFGAVNLVAGIPAGQTSTTVTISPVDDALVEGDESVTLTVTAGSYQIGAASNATITISDNDVPVVSVTPTFNMSEAGASQNFTFQRTGSLTAPMTVDFTLSGTATNGVDYALVAGQVTFAAANQFATVTIDPVVDISVEGIETVVVTLVDGVAYDVGTNSSASMTIADALVSIAVTDGTASEDGPDPGTFTISRTGDTTGPLTVGFVASGATRGVDYVDFGTSITIPAGQASADLTVTPILDALTEGPELVNVFVSAGSYLLGNAFAQLSIADSNAPTVTVVATANAAEGGASGTFTVTRTGPTTSAQDWPYALSGTATLGADYTVTGSTVVAGYVRFNAGDSSVTLSVNAFPDAVIDPAETVVLTLSGGPDHIVGTPGAATMTIAEGSPVVTVVATANAAEGGASGIFTVTRTGPTTSVQDWPYALGGTATLGADYTVTGSTVVAGYVRFNAGDSSVTLSVNAFPDAVLDPAETVVLTLSGGPDHVVGTPGAATMTIAEGSPVVTVVATANAAEGGASGIFTVTRTGPTTSVQDWPYALGGTATLGADYTVTGSTVVAGYVRFNAGDSSVTLSVNAFPDAVLDPAETVVLTLSGGPDHVVGTPGAATMTIAEGSPVVTVVATANAAEGGASGIFTVTRTGPTTSVQDWPYALSGTATLGADYTVTGSTVVAGYVRFNAGDSSVTLSVNAISDGLVDPGDTVVLTLTGGADHIVGTPGAATVTIVDEGQVVITATDPSAAELGPDTATFTIARNGPTTSARVVRVDLTGTATPGTDYAVSSAAPLQNFGAFIFVTIPAGEVSATVIVTPIYEEALEPAETVILTGEGSTAQATIADEPAATITATDATAAELGPDTATFAVTRGGAVGYARVVRVDLTGTATPGTDYAVSSAAPLQNFGAFIFVTIPAGQVSATVIVTPIYEEALEPAETVILTGEGSTAQATIADEPAATITATDATAAELGPDTATFAVTRGGAVGYARVVRVDLTGTATPGTDYAVSSAAPLQNFGAFIFVTIPAGQASATVIVTPLYEVALEPAETVILTGEGATAQATIADEPAATITATDATAAELGPDTATFAVTRGGAVGYARVVRVDLTGTATPGTDYAVSSTAPLSNFGSFFDLTIPAGQASATVIVTPLYEVALEPAETVILTGEGATAQATIADEPAATITVTDATAAELGPNTATFAVTRGGAVGYTRVVRVDLTGTATPGTDYAVSSAAPLQNFGAFIFVTIPAGQVSATVIVTPVADGMFEGQETVTFTAEGSVATAAIADDVVVTIAATDSSATEGGDTAAFAVSRTGSTTQLLDVRVDVTGGSASLGIDYNFFGNASIVSSDSTGFVVRIPAGQASATFTMTAMTDALVEPPETVALTAAGVVATATIVGVTNITMTLSDAAATEGLDTARITLTRSGATTLDQDLRVDIIGGTATLGVDYHFLGNPSIVFSGPTWFVVRIPAGQASVSFTMTGSADVVTETSETAILSAEGMFVTATIFDLITGPLTMGFEEQPDSIPAGTVFPSSYRGMTFTNWLHYAPIPLLTPNGVNALYAAVDGARFTFSQRVFVGASFSRWAGAAPGNVYFELYHQGVLVHTSAILADLAPNLTFLPSGYSGAVDEVRVRFLNGAMVPAGSTLLIDDIMFQ